MTTFMSVYSGCGGMDYGFWLAGMEPVYALDSNQDAVDSYNVNFPHEAYCGDVEDAIGDMTPGMADVVIGGPPCQGFSVSGKMDPGDQRSQQVFRFMDVVDRVRPHAFVMENVAALAESSRWLSVITELVARAEVNYDVQLDVVDAAWYSVPQHRRRMFLIGLPKGTGAVNVRRSTAWASLVTAQGAIARIPKWMNTDHCNAVITLARNPVIRKSPYAGMLLNGGGRVMNLREPAPTLPASMGGNRTPIIDLNQLKYAQVPWIEEYHMHLLNGGKPFSSIPSYADMRRITLQEAASLQSFPEEFTLRGSLTSRYRQVGNAVPPLLAKGIAKALIYVLLK